MAQKEVGAREAGEAEPWFFQDWVTAVCGGLGSQDDPGIKWPEGRLMPFSEKVNAGPSGYTGARGASPGALGLRLGPAQVCSRHFAFHRQRWEPVPATPVTCSSPGGDCPGGEDVFHLFSLDGAPPKEA